MTVSGFANYITSICPVLKTTRQRLIYSLHIRLDDGYLTSHVRNRKH